MEPILRIASSRDPWMQNACAKPAPGFGTLRRRSGRMPRCAWVLDWMNIWHPLSPRWFHLNTARAGSTVSNRLQRCWISMNKNMQLYADICHSEICRYMQIYAIQKYVDICIHMLKYAFICIDINMQLYAKWKYANICSYMQRDKYASYAFICKQNICSNMHLYV